MPKQDFSNAEKALEKRLQQMEVEELLKLADQATGNAAKKEDSLTQDFKRLTHQIHFLAKENKSIYLELKTSRKEIDALDTPEKIKGWLEKVSKKLEALLKKSKSTISDEEQIEKERAKHKTKRFNVNEKWLPLD